MKSLVEEHKRISVNINRGATYTSNIVENNIKNCDNSGSKRTDFCEVRVTVSTATWAVIENDSVFVGAFEYQFQIAVQKMKLF